MDFLYNYGLFLAKSATLLACFIIAILALVIISMRQKQGDDGKIGITKVNERFDDLESSMLEALLPADDYKAREKAKQKTAKKEKKQQKKSKKQHKEVDKTGTIEVQSAPSQKKRIFVLDFDGDIKASEVELLREEITAILLVATEQDEVVLRLESAGGMVHPYGLAAAQLQRLKDRRIPLTVSVDQMAASGGYMMACVADKLLAAPFAIIGSIGVIAQIPNFNRLLKKHDIDFEMHTAGKYKRTLTMFGENSNTARDKFKEELEDTHVLFKAFVHKQRPIVDVDEIATGEHWYGQQALRLKLVDQLQTSDDYLLSQYKEADIYEVAYDVKKGLSDRLSEYIELQLARIGIVQR